MNAETVSTAPTSAWPVPPEWPLYVSVDQAAKIAGVSYDLMRKWADAQRDPVPHITVGRKKKLVRVAALPAYLEKKEGL